MTLRGALIGCGYIVPTHIRAWAATSGAAIVAVCDPDRARAEAAAARLGTDLVFGQAEALCRALDGQLDFLDVTTPPASHAGLLAMALEHGLHVLCQKPLAETEADLRAIADLAAHTDRVVAVNEMWKWIPGYARAGELIRGGALGNISSVRFKSGSNFLLPRIGDDRRATSLHPRFLTMDRLIIFEYGIHVLDMMRHWFGEPVAVRATTAHANPYCPGEDQASITIRYDGFRIDIDLDWCLAGAPVLDVLEGDSLVASGSGGLLTVQGGRSVAWHPAQGAPSTEAHEGDLRDAGFRRTHAEFVRAIVHGGKVSSPVDDNARSVRLMLACYKSAAEAGTWLDGPDFGLEAGSAEQSGSTIAREETHAL